MHSAQLPFNHCHLHHAVFGFVSTMMLLLSGQTIVASNEQEVVSKNDDLSKNHHLRGTMGDAEWALDYKNLLRVLEEEEEGEQCEDLANGIIEDSLGLVERLSDPEILSIMCFPEERERLLKEIEETSQSEDPCVQMMYQEISQNHIEVITALESEEGCHEEISRELEVAHYLEEAIRSRRGLTLKDANHRELNPYAMAIVFAAKVVIFGLAVSTTVKRKQGRRHLLEREGVEETFSLIKDEPFVVPSNINRECEMADYEVSLIMTQGPHFLIGAMPIESAVEKCPMLAFDSNGFHETKTMFVMENGSGWISFKDDPMFTLGEAKLENVLHAFDAVEPLELNKFHVEDSNCFHFAQAMWRHLDLPESEGLLNFVVENVVNDENIGRMLIGVGSSGESREAARSDKEMLKDYIYKITSDGLDLSG